MFPVNVSVVICTYNRADMLRDALASLVAQDTDGQFHYEVVVVDNRSTDHTRDVVEELARRAPVPVRYVHESDQGQVPAHNRGIREAAGEWVAHFDDDQIADRRWLLELWRLAREKPARSVGGRVDLQLPDDFRGQVGPITMRLLGGSFTWTEPRRYGAHYSPGSGNHMAHRSVYAQIGTYDPAYERRGYDTDFHRRMEAAGIESWFAPNARILHVTPWERLGDEYLHRIALTNGWILACRDRDRYGRLGRTTRAMARAVQHLIVTLPRRGYAWLRADDALALDMRLKGLVFIGYLNTFLAPNRPSRTTHSALVESAP